MRPPSDPEPCFVASQTPAYSAAVDALRRLPGPMIECAYAEATWRRAKAQWSIYWDLTRASGEPCACRLLGKRSHDLVTCELEMPSSDHLSLWNYRSAPAILVSQPYDLEAKQLVDFCDVLGLEVRIGTWTSWHYPGRTIHVAIAKPDTWKRLSKDRVERQRSLRRDTASELERAQG